MFRYARDIGEDKNEKYKYVNWFRGTGEVTRPPEGNENSENKGVKKREREKQVMTANELHGGGGEKSGMRGMLVSGKQQRVRAKISLHQSFPIPGVRPINVGRPPALAREKPNRVLFGRALPSARNRGRNRERRQGSGGIDILSVRNSRTLRKSPK